MNGKPPHLPGWRPGIPSGQPSPNWQRPWRARSLSQVLDGLGGGLREERLLARIDDIWNDLVGKQIAEISRVEELAGGELRVRVSHPVWRTELGGLAEEIRARLLERLAAEGVNGAEPVLRRLRFV